MVALTESGMETEKAALDISSYVVNKVKKALSEEQVNEEQK